MKLLNPVIPTGVGACAMSGRLKRVGRIWEHKKITRATLVLFAIMVLPDIGQACDQVVGYFHQVTAMRGRVIGANLKLAPLLKLRWLRQQFSIEDATVALYEYRWPAKVEDLKQIGLQKVGAQGRFDFGAIPSGHYVLTVEIKGSDEMGGSFDVEVTNKVKSTKEILLDISPINPDCTGGHEFIEKKL